MQHKNNKKHDKEHKNWSRRQFLMTGGIAALGGVTLGNSVASAFAPNPLLAALNETDTDRILVLIFQSGGNDSLNMIIPYSVDVGRDEYISYRPQLARKYGTHYDDNTLLANHGASNFALPSNMEPLMDFWNNDNMHVVHNVGYSRPSLSHFISRDLWFDGAENVSSPQSGSGWMGRYLEQVYPSFLDAPPSVPPALQIGTTSSRVFTSSEGGGMELVFSNPADFYAQASIGQLYDTAGLGDCPQDAELGFIRQVANNSFTYAESTFGAFQNSADMPTVNYTQNDITDQLRIVARLIKGGLGTKIYMVKTGGFDNHGYQERDHPGLLSKMATSIREFHEDLKKTGEDERVISFPFSEFGRTIRENRNEGAARGTEHGTLADVTLYGKGIKGGFSGTPANMRSQVLLDGQWRLDFDTEPGTVDYRSIYATLLQDWLCLTPAAVDFAMGDYFPRLLNLIENPCSTDRKDNPEILLGHRAKVADPNITEIRYGVFQPGVVIIDMYNKSGQKLVNLVNEFRSRGTYIFEISPNEFPFPPGEYFYKLKTGGKEYSRKISF